MVGLVKMGMKEVEIAMTMFEEIDLQLSHLEVLEVELEEL